MAILLVVTGILSILVGSYLVFFQGVMPAVASISIGVYTTWQAWSLKKRYGARH